MWIFSRQVGYILWQNPRQRFELRGLHRLDNELVVVAEEKEATALSRAFSRLEGIFAVECWAEAFLNKVQVQIACFEEFSKKVHAVVRDTEVCVNKLASTDHRI